MHAILNLTSDFISILYNVTIRLIDLYIYDVMSCMANVWSIRLNTTTKDSLQVKGK